MKQHLKNAQDSNSATIEKVTREQALELIREGGVEDHAGFDAAEAERLRLTLAQTVAVSPTDTGKRIPDAPTPCFLYFFKFLISYCAGKNHPTVGILVGLNKEEVVIQVKGTCGTPLNVHFPRLGFVIRGDKAKL
jgi:hypothetical protein